MDKASIENAIRAFTSKLLSGPAAPLVLKIFHFGSTSRDDYGDWSDVDLLVLSSNGEVVKDEVAAAAFEAQMETGLGVEPIVEGLDQITPVTDYFLYTVLTKGKEVYSVEADRIRKESRDHFTSLAEEYLVAARDALSAGHVRLAVDGGYNALELALKAMILMKREDLPGSHGGIVGAFGEEFVKGGRFPPEIGRRINRALELRNAARYKHQALVREEDGREVLDLASRMIEATRSMN